MRDWPKPSILIILFLLNTNAYSTDDGYEDENLVIAIDKVLKTINKEWEIYCKEWPSEDTDKKYRECSDQQISEIQDAKFVALQSLEKIVLEINKLKKKSKEMNEALDMINCISSRISIIKLDCSEDSRLCKKGPAAHTAPFFNFWIYLCKGYWNYKSGNRIDDKIRSSKIIHEVAHHCGATDSAYFDNKKTIPHRTLWSSWPQIADTYEYWVQYGFTIPKDDESK